MADRRTTESEHRSGVEATPRDGVEVFDANTTNTTRDNEAMTGADLRTNDRANPGITTGTTGQGANWGTILMVIAIILVIILLGTWIF